MARRAGSIRRPWSSGWRASTPSEVNQAGETRVRKLLLVSRESEVDALIEPPRFEEAGEARGGGEAARGRRQLAGRRAREDRDDRQLLIADARIAADHRDRTPIRRARWPRGSGSPDSRSTTISRFLAAPRRSRPSASASAPAPPPGSASRSRPPAREGVTRARPIMSRRRPSSTPAQLGTSPGTSRAAPGAERIRRRRRGRGGSGRRAWWRARRRSEPAGDRVDADLVVAAGACPVGVLTCAPGSRRWRRGPT